MRHALRTGAGVLLGLVLLLPFVARTTQLRNGHAMTTDGLLQLTTQRAPGEVLDRLEAVLRARGIHVFVRVDHAKEAGAVGLAMPPTQVLVFGNPKAGTPMMLASPDAAFDLPLRVLARSGPDGVTRVLFADPEAFARRHGLEASQVAPVAAVRALVEAALRDGP